MEETNTVNVEEVVTSEGVVPATDVAPTAIGEVVDITPSTETAHTELVAEVAVEAAPEVTPVA